MMMQLDVGVHDLWVNEEFVTFNELYTYQHNQEKLKSIENAKIQVIYQLKHLLMINIFQNMIVFTKTLCLYNDSRPLAEFQQRDKGIIKIFL